MAHQAMVQWLGPVIAEPESAYIALGHELGEATKRP